MYLDGNIKNHYKKSKWRRASIIKKLNWINCRRCVIKSPWMDKHLHWYSPRTDEPLLWRHSSHLFERHSLESGKVTLTSIVWSLIGPFKPLLLEAAGLFEWPFLFSTSGIRISNSFLVSCFFYVFIASELSYRSINSINNIL